MALRGDEATAAVRALAEQQHGVVARRQLRALGIGRKVAEARVRGGAWVKLHHGVYAVGHAALPREGRWMAAVLACGPGAVLSHATAAALWGIRPSTAVPEVTRRSGARSHRGIWLHQTRMLEEVERTVEKGIPVTSTERTLLDIAVRLDGRRLERAIVEADRAGLLRWGLLVRLCERTPMRPGAGRLARAALALDPSAVEARSGLEVDFLAICRRSKLPTPAVNVLVEGHLVDFLWPAERVIVETDGYAYHSDRGSFERDREMDMRLRAAGYEVHRVTHRMLSRDPDSLIALLRRSLSTRTRIDEPTSPGESRSAPLGGTS